MAYIRYILILFFALSPLAMGGRVSFEALKNELLKRNLKIKISKKEIDIVKEKYKVERSTLFPMVKINFYNEFIKDLRNLPSYIEGQYYIGNTGYSSSLSFSIDYELFDFGSRKYRLKMFKTSIDTSKENLIYTQQEQILNLLDRYYKALINQYKLKRLNQLRSLYIDLYKLKQRLYKAGIIPKEDLVNVTIKLAEISTQIEEIKQNQNSIINEISFLVDKKLNDPYFEDFEQIFIERNSICIENLPEVAVYDKKIKEKKYQLRSKKLQFFPKVQIFGVYSLSNFNEDEYLRAVRGLQPVNWRIGFAVRFTIFNGFKTVHSVMQIKKEIEKLRLERLMVLRKKKYEIKTDYMKLEQNHFVLKQINTKLEKLIENLRDKEKLYDVGKESKINVIQKQINIVNEKLNLELKNIENLFIAKKLKILKEFSVEHRFGSN